ncbi:MAG: hypothetical protein ACRDRL_22545 [Sciscionella sp.]
MAERRQAIVDSTRAELEQRQEAVTTAEKEAVKAQAKAVRDARRAVAAGTST